MLTHHVFSISPPLYICPQPCDATQYQAAAQNDFSCSTPGAFGSGEYGAASPHVITLLISPSKPEPSPLYASSHPNPSGSPLRKGVTLDPLTGTFSEDGSPDDDLPDHDPWGTRDAERPNHSPSPSITKLASSFAQRVGSLVSSVSPGSQLGHLPTEAELEAEAESQRERSRREAERILTQEATERKNVEQRVLEMLQASRPSRSQTVPSPAPPSPTPSSSKDGGGGWWSAAKNKLTSKEKELTPAQQIVLDTKAREKERRKSKEKEWPSNGKSKYTDPAYQSLSLPPGARPPGGVVGGGANVVPTSPGSPSPHSNQPPRQLTDSPTLMTHSPSRSLTQLPFTSRHDNSRSLDSTDLHPLPRRPAGSPGPPTSPSRDPPLLYAQFSTQGALDMPGTLSVQCYPGAFCDISCVSLATLLTIARRFEKLERWAVGHVRALEERMSDVEKWLVDKEREREQERETATFNRPSNGHPEIPTKEGEKISQQVVREVTIERKTVEVDGEVKREVGQMKEELGELRGRVGQLGQEMARLASTSSNSVSHSGSASDDLGFGIGRIISPGSTGPSTPAAPSPRILPAIPVQYEHPRSPTHSIAQSETASIVSSGTSTRTKLPYPTGDYTSPSPPRSPPPRFPVSQNVGNYTANNASSNISRTRPLSYSGLPVPQTIPSSVGLPRSSGVSGSAAGSPSLPPLSTIRPLSTSPNPRKRYTVALGQPLSSSPSASSSAVAADTIVTRAAALDEKRGEFGESLFSDPQTVELQTAFFTQVPSKPEVEENDRDRHHGREDKGGADLQRQETIGKTPITLSRLSLSPPPSQNSSPSNGIKLERGSPRPSPSNPRARAQSTYGVPGSLASSVSPRSRPDGAHGSVSPLLSGGMSDGIGSWQTRSRSIDRVGLGIDAGQGVGNFVDPLVVRKKEKEAGSRSSVIASPGGQRGRVAFGDLLAFFDAEKQ